MNKEIDNSIWDNEDLQPITADVLMNEPERLRREREEEKKAIANPFPIEVFPKPIQEIITATHTSLNFPIDFMGASILNALSVSIGNTYKAEIKNGWQESAILYMAIVGRSGTIKSHPFSFALKPIEERDKLSYKKYLEEKQEYDKVAALNKKERIQEGYDDPVKPVWKQHLVTDFTPESLAEVLKFNNRGIGVYADELAAWVMNFNRYNKGSEEQFWLSAWNGKTIRINRKTSEPVYITLPFISVAGTIQPGVLHEIAKKRTENGFLDRLLFVVPDSIKRNAWSTIELSPEIEVKWNSIISILLNESITLDDMNYPKPHVLMFTPEAKAMLYKWQRELTDISNQPENEATTGIYAKIEVYAIRFALILEMARFACGEGNRLNIDTEAVQGAKKLADYFIKAALKVHSLVTNASPLAKLTTIQQNLYNALPDAFKTGEGLKIAESMGMPERTFKRLLSENLDLFSKYKQGEYEKRF